MIYSPIRELGIVMALGVAFIALSGCANTPSLTPQTPRQALLESRAALTVAVAGFNVYASQRPFCGQVGAKPAPLCADRAAVIEGADQAHKIANGLDAAEVVIQVSGTSDIGWAALASPSKMLAAFQAWVASKGTK